MRGFVNFYSTVIACWAVAALMLALSVWLAWDRAWIHALGALIAFLFAFAFGLSELQILRRLRREAMRRPPFTTTARGFPEQPRRPLR